MAMNSFYELFSIPKIWDETTVLGDNFSESIEKQKAKTIRASNKYKPKHTLNNVKKGFKQVKRDKHR